MAPEDTGHPGHGTMPQGEWNPERPGRLADLIIEPERLHTPDDDPRVKLMPRGGRIRGADCLKAVSDRSDTLSGSFSLEKLREGTRICLRTDEDRIALVSVKALDRDPPATMRYSAQVWEAQ